MRFVSMLVCTAALTTAQSPLTTTFANNNGGAIGGAIYFDLTDTLGAGITVVDLDLNLGGTAGTIDVYGIFGGTFRGNEGNMAAWTLLSSGPVAPLGVGQPTNVVLSPAVSVAPMTTAAIALVANGVSHAYTSGMGAAGTPQVFATSELTLTGGTASNVPFTAPLFDPRVVNTNINYVLGATGNPATNTSLGEGCIREVSSFYESFPGGTFDLNNTSITLQNTGAGYVVSSGGTYNPVGSLAAATTLVLADDSQIAAGTLGLTVGSNGWVASGAGNSNSFVPTIATLLGNPATAFYCWKDLNPAAIGSGQVQYEEDAANGLAQITFDGVFNFGGSVPNFLQFQVDTNTDSVVISWLTMVPAGTETLVGYSPGGASSDPGASDLSEVANGNAMLQIGLADIVPLALEAVTRPVLGSNWTLLVRNIPPTTVLGVYLFGTMDPGILDLGFLGLPGCQLRSSPDFIGGPWASPASTFGYSFPVPAGPPVLIGFEVFTQAATFAFPPVNSFGAITSNGILGTVGDL